MMAPNKPVAAVLPPNDRVDLEQFAEFVKAARELGCDDSEEAFGRRFSKYVPPHELGGATATRAREVIERAKAPKRRARKKE